MQMNALNYSVDTLKKAAFVDELNSVLKVLEIRHPGLVTAEFLAVKEYFEKRIKQIDGDYRDY